MPVIWMRGNQGITILLYDSSEYRILPQSQELSDVTIAAIVMRTVRASPVGANVKQPTPDKASVIVPYGIVIFKPGFHCTIVFDSDIY